MDFIKISYMIVIIKLLFINNLVKLETNSTVILPPTVNIFCCNYSLHHSHLAAILL